MQRRENKLFKEMQQKKEFSKNVGKGKKILKKKMQQKEENSQKMQQKTPKKHIKCSERKKVLVLKKT